MRIIPKGTFLLPLLVLSIGSLLYGFALADRRAQLYEIRRRQAIRAKELQGLRQERKELLDERERLLTEPSAIERVAREQYGLVAPGEVVAPVKRTSNEVRKKPAVVVGSDGWDWLFGRGEYPWQVPALAVLGGTLVLGGFELPSLLKSTSAEARDSAD